MSEPAAENVGAPAEEEADQSKLFKKILSEMHNEFNKYQGPITNPYVVDSGEKSPKPEEPDNVGEKEKPASEPSVPPVAKEDVQDDSHENGDVVKEEEQKVDTEQQPSDHPRIILKLKSQEDPNRSLAILKKSGKQSSKTRLISYDEQPMEKRTRRGAKYSAEADLTPKRTSRRTSRDFSKESVLQNAIARKEKSLISFSQEEKPRRSSRISEELRSAAKLRGKMLTRSLTSLSSVEDAPSATAGMTTDGGGGESIGTSSGIQRSPSTSGHLETDETSSGDESSSVEHVVSRRPRSFKSSKESSPEWVIQHDPKMECATDSLIQTPDSTKKNVINEENGLRLKMSAASPRIPEASEPPNQPVRGVNKDAHPSSEAFCECDRVTSLYVKNDRTLFCQGLDSYDDKLVKCSNLADDKVPLLRASKIVPFQQYCLAHFQRSMRHNACATCSIFCTQGVFLVCANRHFFHEECERKTDGGSAVCPHCGSLSYSLHKLQLHNHVYPLLLPPTKPIDRTPLARITFHKSVSNRKIEVDAKESIDEVVKPLSLTLSNGKVITSIGIPLVENQQLEILLNHSLPPTDQRYSFRNLHYAAKIGDAEKVLAMLASGLSPNQPAMNPLHAAVREGHLLVVHLLVQAGASLETLDKSLYTPLMVAVFHKHNDIAKYLIRSGADKLFKGPDGMTALHIAAKEGNLEAVHYLLTVANTPRSFIDIVDNGRWTALVWAAENNHRRIVRYLLEKGADPHIRDKEMNIALHWSALSGSMEITEDLLNYGCSINLSNVLGDTPLHIAARQGADNCVVLLLARGARVDAVNKAGQLPRDCVLVPGSYCKIAIEMNMTLRKTVDTGSFSPKILCNDVSLGREENPIQCVNAIDDDAMPTDYTYVTENCYTSNIAMDRRISSLLSCKCPNGDCLDGGCMCCKISRGSWYDASGKLVPEFSFEDPPMIFECNRACGCNILTCRNRVVQRGLKTRLQLCKTKDKSWGVVALKDIPKGTYVCEYVGEIISDLEADTRKDDSYLFDLDNAEFGLSLVSPRNSYDFEGETYCLDARKYGNICRFINHSCRPNLAPVKVFDEHHDLHFPRIAMFATRDIAADEELGFDYGDKFWIIKCKSFTCHCGEEICRYSERTIQKTLDNYQEKLKELDAIDALV